MVNLGCWLSVFALETLVANSRQVHVSSLLSNLDTLEPVKIKIDENLIER